MFKFYKIPSFRFPRFISCHLTITTSPSRILDVLFLRYKLCLSLRATRYPWGNRVLAASLHFITYFYYFLHISVSSPDVSSWISIEIVSRFRLILFGVNDWWEISYSMYVSALLFKLTSISRSTSSNSSHLTCVLPILLYRVSFAWLINRSN